VDVDMDVDVDVEIDIVDIGDVSLNKASPFFSFSVPSFSSYLSFFFPPHFKHNSSVQSPPSSSTKKEVESRE
jgi:hypothetical protein